MEDAQHIKFFFWIGTLVMLLLAVGIIAFIAVYRKRLLEMEQRESEHLLKISLEFENRERKHIAAELHDSVCGDVSAVKNYLAVIEQISRQDTVLAMLKEAKSNLDSVLRNTKAISYNLMPPLLDSSGLIPVLQSYFLKAKTLNNVEIEFIYDIPVTTLPASHTFEIFRVVQELLTNMFKHGKATTVNISLNTAADRLTLTIVDDGHRFSIVEMLKKTQGLGLKNIYFRLSIINAKMLQHPSEIGNHLELIIPLK